MRNDATEVAAVQGLLGLGTNVDFRSTPTIPLKRKSSTTFSTPSNHEVTSTIHSSDSISCICGFTYDDGFSIQCDDCDRWAHVACFDIVESDVPDQWRCWECEPRPVNRERAVKLQKARQRQAQEVAIEKAKRRVSPGVERKQRRTSAVMATDSANTHTTTTKRKRRASTSTHHPQPQVEDEHIDIDEPSTHSYVHVDTDVIPHQRTRDRLKRLAGDWRGLTALDSPVEPVLLHSDAFPPSPQTTLRAFPNSSLSHPSLSSNSNPSVRPPAYTVHTTQPIPSSALIAPYTSTIVPSSAYLSDPLNAYAHLSMPKPFVHLFGPPLDVALDARMTGQQSRYVRNGCRPNAVLRPVICQRHNSNNADTDDRPGSEETLSFAVFALRDLKENEEVVLGWEWDDGSVIHHLPALINSPHLFAPCRFEQYRYQMTSMLHALSSTFTTCACGAKARDCALNRLAEFVDGQMPPTPSPSPPSLRQDGRSFSSSSRDNERRDRDGDGDSMEVDLGPLIGVERGFRTREKMPMSGGIGGVEVVNPGPRWRTSQSSPEAGPSRLPLGVTNAQPKPKDRKGKARAVEADDVPTSDRSAKPSQCNGNKSRRARAGSFDTTEPRSRSPRVISAVSRSDDENKMPPKLRKGWIRRNTEVLREANREICSVSENVDLNEIRDRGPGDGGSRKVVVDTSDGMDIDDAQAMPPPPLPPSLQSSSTAPTSTAPSLSEPPSILLSSTSSDICDQNPQTPFSPSIPFANLSLLSPVVLGATACFPNSAQVHGASTVGVTSSIVAPSDPPSTMTPTIHLTAIPERTIVPSVPLSTETQEDSSSTQSNNLPLPPDSSIETRHPVIVVDDTEVLPADTPAIDKPITVQSNSVMSSHDSSEAMTIESSTSPSSYVSSALDGLHDPNFNGTSSVALSSLGPSVPQPPRSNNHSASTGDEYWSAIIQGFGGKLNNALPPHDEQYTKRKGKQDNEVVEESEKMKVDGQEEPVAPPVESTKEPSPPPPPPKVKLSLKDFAARKKQKQKQREEELKSAAASPDVVIKPLGTDGDPATAPTQTMQELPDLEKGLRQLLQQERERERGREQAVRLHNEPPIPDKQMGLDKPSSIGCVNNVTSDSASDLHGDAVSTKEGAVDNVEVHMINGDSMWKLGPSDTLIQNEQSKLSSDPRNAFSMHTQKQVKLESLLSHPLPGEDGPLKSTSTIQDGEAGPNGKVNLVQQSRISPPPPPALPPLLSSLTKPPLSRQVSQEDGEILSPPPQRPPPFAPRSHTPPTHPRSFHSHSMNGSSPASGPSLARRVIQPPPVASHRVRPFNNIFTMGRPLPGRPLPSAPRALRLTTQSSSHQPLHSSPSRSLGGSPHPSAPRGPSADRDREHSEWDRERSWSGSGGRGGRSNSGGSGWAR